MTLDYGFYERKWRLCRHFLQPLKRKAVILNEVKNLFKRNCIINNSNRFIKQSNIIDINFRDSSFRFASFRMTLDYGFYERKWRLCRHFLQPLKRKAVILNEVKNLFKRNCIIHNSNTFIKQSNIIDINFRDSSFRFASFRMTLDYGFYERKWRQSRHFLQLLKRKAVILNEVKNLFKRNCIIHNSNRFIKQSNIIDINFRDSSFCFASFRMTLYCGFYERI